MKCFLDQDGVIADFVKGACEAHNRPDPYLDPKNLGIELHNVWKMSIEEFLDPCENFKFWSILEKTEEADFIVETVIKHFGVNNVAIATTPSSSGMSITGKRFWMERCYPKLAEGMIFTSNKKMLASEDAVLIDDRDKNIDEFSDSGGRTIIIPRPWNSWNCIKDGGWTKHFEDVIRLKKENYASIRYGC